MSKYSKLADFGRELLNKKSFDDGLPYISKYVKEVLEADRCSIFIYSNAKQELWTTLADGVERIVVDSNIGLVGETFKTQAPIIENDPYSNPNFFSKIDQETGYETKNVITAPIFDSTKEIQGVLQVLNKENGFNTDDVKFMVFFANYISGFLELIQLYETEENRL